MMDLIEAMMVPCCYVDLVHVPDGEGGSKDEWRDGAEVMVAITNDTSLAAMVAEKEGVKATYRLTTINGVVLEFPNVIKRLSDGKTFRVVNDGNDRQSPTVGTLDFSTVNAERWEVPR